MKYSYLRLHSVTKKFTQESSVTEVLRDITALFYANKTYVLTGKSGTGKSTLLHLIAGLDEPTSGAIYYNERNLTLLDNKQRQAFLRSSIGLVFQTHHMIRELSVLENVMIKGLIEGKLYLKAQKQALELLELVGLQAKAYLSPSRLSGGERQRVAIARALFNKPLFLLADEPTAHLDDETSQDILHLLRSAQQEWYMGLIIASHDKRIMSHCDKILTLEKGILSEGRNNSVIKELDY